jgi:hypothetical protein
MSTPVLQRPISLRQARRLIASAGRPPCVFCGGATQGNYAIHRDGFGIGPEVDLCDDCGSESTPTCEEIWACIAQP